MLLHCIAGITWKDLSVLECEKMHYVLFTPLVVELFWNLGIIVASILNNQLNPPPEQNAPLGFKKYPLGEQLRLFRLH